ncbi:MAG TPA: tryptophan--tRNA ligase, partial [bacterium]|nr:tryptophan--tRNA ligase [bacterium]
MGGKKEKIILTGLRPTGALHIGNYFGALLPFVKMQETADKFFLMVADLHALTTLEDSKNLGQNSLSLAMAFVASGIDLKKSVIFVQSQIPQHSELAIALSMITPVPMLELNPTYKEMREEHPKNNNLGLLAYPILQASDILIYKSTEVPVGKDQSPHIEIAREIARKFNNRFGNVFPEPKTILQKEAKIFSLQEPSQKMSKSHGEKTYIALFDSPDIIREKIKIAVTDSGREIKYDEKNKPAISNLLTIYSLFEEKPIKEIEKEFEGKTYAEFKKDLAEIIIKGLAPLQKKYKELEKKPAHIKSVLEDGAKKAEKIASQTMLEVR